MITLEFYNRKNNYMEVKTKFNVGNKVKIHVLGTPYITRIKYIKINHDTLMYAVSVFGTEICLLEHMLRPVEESSNRKEQAQIAAVENADKRLKEVDRLDFAVAAIADYDNGLTTGFKDGVEWADKTMINAACEWLLHNAYLYVGEFTGDLDEELLLKEFRKAMEE